MLLYTEYLAQGKEHNDFQGKQDMVLDQDIWQQGNEDEGKEGILQSYKAWSIQQYKVGT